MRTVEQLREALYLEKEQFDQAVFGKWMSRPDRLLRWRAFLKRIAPLAQELKRAERYEARVGIRHTAAQVGAAL